jgi:hypothetical protein
LKTGKKLTKGMIACCQLTQQTFVFHSMEKNLHPTRSKGSLACAMRSAFVYLQEKSAGFMGHFHVEHALTSTFFGSPLCLFSKELSVVRQMMDTLENPQSTQSALQIF